MSRRKKRKKKTQNNRKPKPKSQQQKAGSGASPSSTGGQSGEVAAQKPDPPPEKKSIGSRIKNVLLGARKESTEQDRKAVTPEPRPADQNLDEMWAMASEARQLLDAQRKKATQREIEAQELMDEAELQKEIYQADQEALKEEGEQQRKKWQAEQEERDQETVALQERLEGQLQEAERLRAEAETEREAIGQRIEEVEQGKQALRRDQAKLAEDQADLHARELNAEADFALQRQESLKKLEQSALRLHEQLGETEKKISDERAEWNEERARKRKTFDDQLAADRKTAEKQLRDERQEMLDEVQTGRDAADSALQQRETTLASDEEALSTAHKELETDRRQLEFDRSELKEQLEELEQRAGQRAAAQQERSQAEIAALERRLETARKAREELEEQLHFREEIARNFGGREEADVARELLELRQQREDLKQKLAERPEPGAAERLASLEEQQESWGQERYALLEEVQELKTRLARAGQASTDLEIQRDLKESAELHIAVLREAVGTLRTELDDLRETALGKSPFPSCAAMDSDEELQEPIYSPTEVGNLEAFVRDLQQRIAQDPKNPERVLHYSQADLRSFLAGLAMGPMLLLQGISGTGKTSLPRAFARAMGTEETMVEVQAGWRDPQDLVGYYNAFERKFYEQELLKGLYRAQTPRYRDTIQIVVLDEMNLSHPEQYFSDFLSLLQHPVDDRLLSLMTHSAPSAPEMFIEGCKLRVPANVWFVGTANHDETTKEFADKSYDRSHVMEFPHRPERFKLARVPRGRTPVSFESLQLAFDQAVKDHADDASRAVRYLDQRIRDPLKDFKVGWGPRLVDQLGRYVPVIRAAGGSLEEAVDHVLATRLLRKIPERYDNVEKDLLNLLDAVQTSWKELGTEPPVKSVRLLEKELRRFGRSDATEEDDQNGAGA